MRTNKSERVHGWIDGWMSRWMDEWIDGWMLKYSWPMDGGVECTVSWQVFLKYARLPHAVCTAHPCIALQCALILSNAHSRTVLHTPCTCIVLRTPCIAHQCTLRGVNMFSYTSAAIHHGINLGTVGTDVEMTDVSVSNTNPSPAESLPPTLPVASAVVMPDATTSKTAEPVPVASAVNVTDEVSDKTALKSASPDTTTPKPVMITHKVI